MTGPLSAVAWTVPFLFVAAGFHLDWTSRRGSVRERHAFACYAAANLAIAADDVAAGAPWWAILSLAGAAWWAWRWWRGWRRRRRARVLGAKSRALITAMVARLRAAARPRSGLRPVPQTG